MFLHAAPKAFLILVALVLVWGFNWPVMKIGVAHIAPLWFATFRAVMGTLCFFAVMLARGRFRLPDRRDLPIVLSIAFIQMALFMGLGSMALQHVPAGRSAILAYTTPVWVTPFAVVFLRERLNALKLAGVVLGLAGVAVMFNPFGFDWSDHEVVLGNGMLLTAAFFWAINIVHVRGHRWHGQPLDLMPWEMLIAVLLLAPLAYWQEGPLTIDWTSTVAGVLVYNGPIATAAAYWALVTVNRNLPAITVSLGLLGVPVTGAVISTIALGEGLSVTLVLGLAFIVGGVAAMTLADRKTTEAP